MLRKISFHETKVLKLFVRYDSKNFIENFLRITIVLNFNEFLLDFIFLGVKF